MLDILRFLRRHPLTRGNVPAAVLRFARYQLLTRTRREVTLPWIENTRLVVRRHTPGASGNIYAGLHEYADMGFLIHFLREEDLFLDIGANVGTWTILASGLCGARTVSVEADPDTADFLQRNIEANGIGDRVTVERTAVGIQDGTIAFTVGKGPENRIGRPGDLDLQEVPVVRLDALISTPPIFIKMDVEGFEEDVIAGGLGTISSDEVKAISTELCTPAVDATLRGLGFERAYYDPQTRKLGPEPNGLASNNSLYVRDLAFCRERVRSAARRRILGKLL